LPGNCLQPENEQVTAVNIAQVKMVLGSESNQMKAPWQSMYYQHPGSPIFEHREQLLENKTHKA